MAENVGAARAKEQTGSDGQTNARNDRKAMDSAGVEPRRWSRWPALAKTSLDEHKTPSLGWHRNRGRVTQVVAARHIEQFRNRELDIRAFAVMLVLVRGDRQRP